MTMLLTPAIITRTFILKSGLWHLATVVVIALAYLAVLYVMGLFSAFAPNGRFAEWHHEIMGGAVMVVPYLIGGIVLGSHGAFHRIYTLFSGLAATIGERTLILTLAYITLLGFRQVRPDGTVVYVEGDANLLTAIQTEAIGYFGWAYILWGIPLSISILYVTAYFVQRRQARKE